jgi:DNA primase
MARLRAPAPHAQAAERQLLALLIAHPRLIEPVAERLGEEPFSDSGLDKLRRGILKHLDAARDLDEAELCAHLRSDGFAPMLDSLLDADEYKIARPYPIHEAQRRWEHVFDLYTRKGLLAEADRAVGQLAEDTNERNFARLAAVVTSRDRSVEFEDEERAAEPGPQVSSS